MNDEWVDPFSTEDPEAQAREERRREREARRRAQLGQRVEEASAPPAEPPAAEPPAAKPPPAPPPPEEPTAPTPEPPPPAATQPPPVPPPVPEPTSPEPETPEPETPEPAAPEPESFIDEPLADEDLTDDLGPVGSAGDWPQAGEPRQPPFPADRPLPRGPREKRVRRRRILAVVAVFLIGLVLAFLALLFQPFHGHGHGRVPVVIPKGSSASTIADILDHKGVVSDSTFFRIRLDLAGSSDQIQAGRYVLASDMSYGDAIDALTHKAVPIKPKVTTVTIPEGYDRVQTASLLRKDGVQGNYLDETKSLKGFDPAKYGAKKAANLEGFLFPATYKLKRKDTAKDLVGQQLAAFQRNIKQVKMGYARSKNLTTYDVVTIASIVQREAGDIKDFPEVAAVVYNRLHDGMPLQVDATIRFAEHNYTKPLTYRDLHLDSPYNSYENSGLPPGPISNPGLAALQAAAHPARVPYHYYVTKPGACGRLLFATTYEQAQRQQARYHNARNAAGGKSPTSC